MNLTNRFLLLSFVILFSFPAIAQTANNLRRTFGSPTQTYVINQNVTLSAEFGDDGQACQMLITERRGSRVNSEVKKDGEQQTAERVLDKTAPLAERGKLIQTAGNVGNCFDIKVEEYEKVTITDYSQMCGSDLDVKKSIQILWKERRCSGGKLVVDSRTLQTRLLAPVPSTASIKTEAIQEKSSILPCPNTKESDYVEYKRIYRKYEISQNAVLTELPHPNLTPEAIAEKTVGKMIIEGILHPCGGAVTDLVFRGSVRNGLAQRASVAMRKIKYKPAFDGELPVPQRIQIEYNFYLCDKAPICTSVKEVME